MKITFSILIILFFSCKTTNLNQKKQCDYIGKTVGQYMNELQKPILDTIPVLEYIGTYPSIILELGNNYSIELIQSISKEEVKSATPPFNINTYKKLKIKCIFLKRKGEIISNCGCKELAEWKNSRN